MSTTTRWSPTRSPSFSAGASYETFPSQTDSHRALRVAPRQDEPIDLLLSDVNMPGLDGFALLKEARKASTRASIVTVLLTGYGTIESAVKAMREGAEDYVTKPVIDEEMLLTVERALKRRRLTQENEQLQAASSTGR